MIKIIMKNAIILCLLAWEKRSIELDCSFRINLFCFWFSGFAYHMSGEPRCVSIKPRCDISIIYPTKNWGFSIFSRGKTASVYIMFLVHNSSQCSLYKVEVMEATGNAKQNRERVASALILVVHSNFGLLIPSVGKLVKWCFCLQQSVVKKRSDYILPSS